MIAEIGHLLLIFSTFAALCLAILPSYGLYQQNPYYISYYRPLTALMTAGLLASYLALTAGFLLDDFSITYVADHSNTQLAWYYKIAGVWGSHQGSMLLWALMMSLWGAGICFAKRYQDQLFIARMLTTLGGMIAGFNLFILLSSNPFLRNLPNIPIEGRDLNPVLQDIGLIIHPPMLFLGYVGLAICFAAAIAALRGGELNKLQASYLRPWVLGAWVALTAGNGLGSWWAYNELGWGGWWFWDPVENSAFIPWLVATGLLHSMMITERKGQLALGNLLLIILAFAFTLLGTFLVRSGIVQSVHAFASDPTRGLSILCLLAVFILGACTLFALKAEQFSSNITNKLKLPMHSRGTALLFGMLICLVAALSVLLGTFYPLIYSLLDLGQLSVGAPYFNSVFVPLVFIACLLMGIAPLLSWHGKQASWHIEQEFPVLSLLTIGIGSLILATGLCYWHLSNKPHASDLWSLWLGCVSACWLMGCLVLEIYQRLRFQSFTLRLMPMYLAHFGVACAIIGASAVSHFEQTAMIRMGPGLGKPLGDYIFVYEATEYVETHSFHALQAKIAVLDQQEQPLTYLYPQRQTFKSNGMEMSQAGIEVGLWRDLYISKGTQLSDSEYLIRINIKPFVSWLWLGAGLMIFGGLLPLCLRSRQQAAVEQASTTSQKKAGSQEKATQEIGYV